MPRSRVVNVMARLTTCEMPSKNRCSRCNYVHFRRKWSQSPAVSFLLNVLRIMRNANRDCPGNPAITAMLLIAGKRAMREFNARVRAERKVKCNTYRYLIIVECTELSFLVTYCSVCLIVWFH